MKIAVCDDNARDLAGIKAAFSNIKERFEIEADYYESGEELVLAVQKGAKYSLAVLDVYMSELNGITTARRLKELLPKIKTAFLTSSADFAVDAFDLGALHYIIKPVTEEKLSQLMERFAANRSAASKNLVLKSKTKAYSFPVSEVQKITSANKGVDICLKGGRVVHIPESFASVESCIDEKVFLKISRGFIVNMSYIIFMNNEKCRFADGTEALISRGEKGEIRRRFNDFLFDGGGFNGGS